MNSPARDATLGANPDPGADDPTWGTSGVMPVERQSFGQLKALYR